MTTVDQVTQTAAQAAQRARGVGEAVSRTLEIGQTGRQAVDDSIAALEKLQEQVESTAESILMLAEQAQAIGEIIATVNDIAEQTNLLALNAAIEASRAGEHGRGFAVVAGEVKALADQSKKATTQVRQILGEIQKATNTAVLSTEEVTKGVSVTTAVASQAGETIKTLTETLTETAQAATQIVASAGQQATGMSQIHQAMKNLDQVARQNLVAIRQVEQAAQNLNASATNSPVSHGPERSDAVDKAKLITRLMNTFLDELQEHVRALNRESLALEKNPAEAERAKRLQELLRTAHSLKGAARSVDLSLIEEACHRLEDLLAGVRDNRVAFDPELFSLLFATADASRRRGCACGSSGTSPTRRSARCCHGSRPPWEFRHAGPSSRHRASRRRRSAGRSGCGRVAGATTAGSPRGRRTAAGPLDSARGARRERRCRATR